MLNLLKPLLIIRIAMAILVFGSGLAVAQEADTVKAKSEKKRWKFNWDTHVEFENNSNVFRLSSSQEVKMKANRPGDLISGRFNSMENVSDLILLPSVEFEAVRKNSFFKRDLTMKGELGYHRFFQNPQASYAGVEISIEQEITKRSRIRLQSEYVPSRFHKNYLADATDDSAHVNTSERVYKNAVDREWDIALDYKHQLLESKKGSLGLTIGILTGYNLSRFDAPFSGRNEDASRFGAMLDLNFLKRWDVEVGFTYKSVSTPVNQEVILLDEPVYLTDLNQDGDSLDTNIRTLQTVDRSHIRQYFDVSVKFELTKDIDLMMSYGSRSKDYSSTQPIDPNYRDRSDVLTSLKFGIEYRLFRRLNLEANYEQAKQTTNRPGDPESSGGDISDYKASIFGGGLAYHF